MAFLDRMERKFGWLAFPGFLRYYAIFHIIVYLLGLVRSDLASLLAFDWNLILNGEVWRVITFLFVSSAAGKFSSVGMIFMLFGMMMMFMVNDGLESAWGEFRTSIFCYVGLFGLIGANFLYSGGFLQGGLFFYLSAFFAFATLFPKAEISIYFVLPVQVRFLAILSAVLIGLLAVSNPLLVPFIAMAFSNYLLFAGIPALRGRAKVMESAQRRKKFKAAKLPETAAFHTCVICGRTDVSDPGLDYRIENDGQEYCEDHLPKKPPVPDQRIS